MKRFDIVEFQGVGYLDPNGDGTLPSDCPKPSDKTYDSKINCRTPLEIAKHVAGVPNILEVPVCFTTCDIQCMAKERVLAAIADIPEPK